MSIRIGIIGGTGLGEALATEFGAGDFDVRDIETPFGRPSSSLQVGQLGDVPVALLQRHGPGHVFNPSAVPVRANVFALKQLGCTHVLASGATGSLREEYHPGSIVLCDQLIDRTDGRVRTFFDHAAVHVEFADPFCPVMRQWLVDSSARLSDVEVHETGTYICMEGPSFSTRAESHLYRQWGADVVGMTALPEARLVREAEMGYVLIALPTDYDCWRARPANAGASPESLIAEIIGNLQKATKASVQLIEAALRDVAILEETPSPAHEALKLGLWTDKSKIPKEEVERLSVLWGKYF